MTVASAYNSQSDLNIAALGMVSKRDSQAELYMTP